MAEEIKNVEMTERELSEQSRIRLEKLNKLVSDCGGYYEQSDVDMGSYYSDGYRYGRYTVRVPKDKYDTFLNSVGEVCHMTSRNESAEDVGLQYYDIESRIRLLEIKQERLMKLLEQATTMEDIITLENALSDIQYQLESNNIQKNRYDSLIDYSTISIRLEQVQRLSGQPLEQQGFSRERKGLSPHITLGREVEPHRNFIDVQKNVRLEPMKISVRSIALMESVRKGPKLVYVPLFRMDLKGK